MKFSLYTTGGPPAPALVVSCLCLSQAEIDRRTDAAEAAAKAVASAPTHPGGQAYAPAPGADVLWHPAFPYWFLGQLEPLPLYQVGAWLQQQQESTSMDLPDYQYLADVLRAALGEEPSARQATNWQRALAWVEQAGLTLLHGTAPDAEAITTGLAGQS